MKVSPKYNPASVEDKWYQYWLEQKLFSSTPNKQTPYTIVMPPPNITGVLHMGHMLNNAIQDILIRYARLKGKNACWVPGIDHASIATEAKVVEKLKKEGIDKNSLSREEFLAHAWEWKEKHGNIILEQLKKLGASCDWSRTKFTLDKELSASVIKVFIHLHNKGLIYKGQRMINWDVKAQTAISNEEVFFKEENSKLYYLNYKIYNSPDEYLTIATTRPETILGDTAVCINPNDKRFSHLRGKKCVIPLIGRVVPIIEDGYVDMEFGTGCLKVTPAHDENDYQIGKRHKLNFINIFTDDGKLNANAKILIGEDRFTGREKIIPLLREAGSLTKVEDYTNKIGYSERTNVVIEPRISEQWFLKMKALAEPALQNVLNDNIKFWPKKFKNIYSHWMNNIQDWCISRQLWWGHQIPAYYLPNGEYEVAENKKQAIEKAYEKTDITYSENELKQDEYVLDTWFSSWLWPISVFDGINNPQNRDYAYYYPTDVLVTAPEIIFFWVARMIITGYEFNNEKPFKNVYFTGIVRDKQRRKMSKQLGNSPEPLLLIKKYGADAVRVGMLLSSQAGNDLLFDEKLILQGRNFANKIWNIFRLISSWETNDSPPNDCTKLGIEWFESRLHEGLEKIETQLSEYSISEALMTIYTLIREDFSAWYLEIIKPPFGEKMAAETHIRTTQFLEKLLILLHPFMPFITEEIWQSIAQRAPKSSIMTENFPAKKRPDRTLLKDMAFAQQVVVNIRNIRKEYDIKKLDKIALSVLNTKKNIAFINFFHTFLCKMTNLKNIRLVSKKPSNSASFRVGKLEGYIPVDTATDKQDEKEKIKKELAYAEGFLKNILHKLNNENFLQHAPKNIIEKEQKKKQDMELKLIILKKHLADLS